MGRGQNKHQEKIKNPEKWANGKKVKGTRLQEVKNQQKMAKALMQVCAVCKSQIPDRKSYKDHFFINHPRNKLPEVLRNV